MSHSVTLYGISNCDTVRKARRWLDAHNLEYHFHDYKKAGIDEQQLVQWCSVLGWETLLNRRGTTWRKLDEADKQDINESSAIRLMATHTSLIKRPVLSSESGTLLVGFDEAKYQECLS